MYISVLTGKMRPMCRICLRQNGTHWSPRSVQRLDPFKRDPQKNPTQMKRDLQKRPIHKKRSKCVVPVCKMTHHTSAQCMQRLDLLDAHLHSQHTSMHYHRFSNRTRFLRTPSPRPPLRTAPPLPTLHTPVFSCRWACNGVWTVVVREIGVAKRLWLLHRGCVWRP